MLAVPLRLGYDIKDHGFAVSSLHIAGLKSKVIIDTSLSFYSCRPFISQYVFKQMTILFAFLFLCFKERVLQDLAKTSKVTCTLPKIY